MSDISNPENQVTLEFNAVGNAQQQAAELSAQIVNLSQHLATLSQRAVQNANVTKAFNQSMGLSVSGVSQYSREISQSLNPISRMTRAVEIQKRVLDQATKSAEVYSAAQRMLNKGSFDPSALNRSNAAMSQSVSHMKAMKLSSNDLQKAMKEVALLDYSRRMGENAAKNQQSAYNFFRNFSLPLITGLREAFFSYSKLATESNRTTKLILDNFNQIGAAGNFEDQVKAARSFTSELGKDLDKITRDWGTSRVLIQSLAGDFAELGISSRIVLGDLTRMTAETEKLGNLDISQSSEFIQTMYQTILRIRRETGKSVDINKDSVANEIISQLRGQLAVFNTIENKTVMSLRNIADAFPEVTAAATSFGLSMTEAMSLVIPMIGAGFQVGASANSVKVSLQRMVAMTKQNTEIINQLNAEMGTGFKYSAGVGMENIQMLTDAYRTLSKSVSEGGKGKQGALEFFSRLFGVRQGPRMETAFAQLAAFQTSLETYNSVERKTADILQSSINAELAVIGGKKIAIKQFLDLTDIHRMAIEKDSNDVLTAQAAAIQKGQKRAQKLLENANGKNSDFISGMSTEVGKALIAQAFDVQSLAGKQFEAELKLSQDTPEVRYRRAKESLMALGRAVVPVVDIFFKGLLPVLEKITTFLQNNPFAAKLLSALLGLVALSGPIRMIFTTMQTAFGGAVGIFVKLSRIISGTTVQFASLQDLIMNPNLLRGQQRVVQYLDGFLIKSKRGARELKEAYDFSGISLPAKEAIQSGGVYGTDKVVNMKRMQPFVPQTDQFLNDLKTMNAQSSAQMATKVANASESGVMKGTENLSSDLQKMFSTVMHRFQGPNLFAGPNYFEGNIPFGGTSGGPGSTRAPRAPRGSGGAIADDLTPEGSAAAIAANEARKARLRPLPFTTYPPGVSRFFTPRFDQADVRNLAIPSSPGSAMPGNLRALIARRQRLSGMFGPAPSTKLAGVLGKGPLALPAGKTPLALGTGSWLSGQSIIQMFQDSGVKLEQQLLFALSNMPDTSVSPQTLEAVKKLIAKKTGIFKLALSKTGVNKTMGKKFVTLPSQLDLGKKFNDTLVRSELVPILNHIDTSIGNQVIAQLNGALDTIPKQAIAELKEIQEYLTPLGVEGNTLRRMKKITTINGVKQYTPVLLSEYNRAFEELFISIEDTTGYVAQSAQGEIGDALRAIQQEFPDVTSQALIPHPKTGRLFTGSLSKHGDALEMFQVELKNGTIRLQHGIDQFGRATVQIVKNSAAPLQEFVDNGVDFYGDLDEVEDKAPKVTGKDKGATYGKAIKPASAKKAKKRIAELKASAAKARGAARIQALKDLDDYIFEQEALVLASRGIEARELLYNPYKDQEKSALTLKSIDEKRRRIAKIKKDMPGAIAKGDIPITAQALAGKYEEFDAAIAALENSIKEEQALIKALPAANPRKKAAGLQKLAKPHKDNIEKLRKDIKKYQTMRNRLADSPAALEAQIEKELATLTRAAPAPLSDIEKLIESERKKLNTKLLSAGDSDLKRRATRKNLTTVNLKERIKRMYEKVTVAGKKLEDDMTEVLSRPERLQQWFSKNLYKVELPDGSKIERFVGSESVVPFQPAMQSGRSRRRGRVAQLKDSTLPTLPPSRFFGPQFDQARIPTVTDFYGKPFKLKDYPLKTSFAQRLFQRPLGVGANIATTGKDIATQFADNLEASLNGILKSSSTEVSKISSAIKKIASHTGHSAAGKNTLSFLQGFIALTDEQINEAMQASITDITRTFRAQTAGGLAGPGTKSQSPKSLAGFFERLRLGLSGKNAKGEKTKVVGVTEAFFGKNFSRLFNKNPAFDSTAGLTNNLNTLFANAMKSAVVGLGSVVEAGSDSDTDRRNAGDLLQPGQERQRSTRKGVQASKKRVRKAIKDAGREALDKVEEVFDGVNQPLLDYSTKLSNEFNNLLNQQQAAVSAVTQSIPSGEQIAEAIAAPIVQAQNEINDAIGGAIDNIDVTPVVPDGKPAKKITQKAQKAAAKAADELKTALAEIDATTNRASEILNVKPSSVNKENVGSKIKFLSDKVAQEEKNLAEAVAAAQAIHPNKGPKAINNLSSVAAPKARLATFKKELEDLEKYINDSLLVEQEKARLLKEKTEKPPKAIKPTGATGATAPTAPPPRVPTPTAPAIPAPVTPVMPTPVTPSATGGAGKVIDIKKFGQVFKGPNLFHGPNIFDSSLSDLIPNFDELMSAPVAESGATLAAAGQAAGAALTEGAAAVQAAASSAASSAAVGSGTGNQSLLSRMKGRLFGSKNKLKLTGESGDAENIIKNKMGKQLIKKGLSLDFNTDGAVTGIRKVSQFGRVTQIELEKANQILSGKLMGNFSRLQTLLGKKTVKFWLVALTGGLYALVNPAKKALSAMKELATSGNYGMSGARKAISEMNSLRKSQGKDPAGKIRTLTSGIGGFFDGGIAKAGGKMLDIFTKLAAAVALIGTAILVIVPIIAIVFGLFNAWKSASGRLDSSIQNLKDAFAAIKEAVSALFAPIRDMINGFSGGNKVLGQFATEGERNAAMFYSITRFIKKAAEAIRDWAKTTGKAFVTNSVAPFLTRLINRFILLGSAIKSMFSGDKEAAGKKLKAFLYSLIYELLNFTKGVTDVIALILKGLIPVFVFIAKAGVIVFREMFKEMMSMAAGAATGIGRSIFNFMVPGGETYFKYVGDPFASFVKGDGWKVKGNEASSEFSNGFDEGLTAKLTGLIDPIKGGLDSALTKGMGEVSKKYAQLMGQGINIPLARALKDPKAYKDALAFNAKKSADAATASGESLGSKIANGMKDKMKEIKDTLKGYFYSNVDAKFDNIIQQYVDALEKQKDKQLKAYDDQIAGIDALAEAEERLTAKKDYETRRREMIDQRATDHENYLVERRLAVYEGRAFDVRRLDREEIVSQRDSNKEIQDLDSGRLSQLQSEQRDLAKQAIANQKELAEKQFQEVLDTFDRFIEDVKNKSFSTQEEFAAALRKVGEQANISSADLSKVFAANIGELPGIIAGVRDPSIKMFSANMNDLIREASKKFGLDANVANPSTILGAVRMMAEGSEAGFKAAFSPAFAATYVQPTVDAIAKITSSLSEKGNKNNIAEIWQKAGEDAFAKLKNELNRDIAFPKILASFSKLLEDIKPLVQQIVTEAAKASAAMEGIGGKPEIADLPQSTIDEWTQSATLLMQRSVGGSPAQRAAMAASATRIVSFIASNLLRGVEGIKAVLPSSGLTPNEQSWAVKIMASINLPGSQVNLGAGGGGPLVPKRYYGGGIGHYGRGGFLEAPASQGIPALLHGGEYIINHKAVEKFGRGNLERINSLKNGGAWRGFASGGYMTTPGFGNGGYMTTPGFANGGYMTTPGFARGGNVRRKPRGSEPINPSDDSSLRTFTNKRGESYTVPNINIRSGKATGTTMHMLDWAAIARSESGPDWMNALGAITKTSRGVFVGPLNISRRAWQTYSGAYKRQTGVDVGNFNNPNNIPSWENQVKIAEMVAFKGIPDSPYEYYRQPKFLDGFEGVRKNKVFFQPYSALKEFDKAPGFAKGGFLNPGFGLPRLKSFGLPKLKNLNPLSWLFGKKDKNQTTFQKKPENVYDYSGNSYYSQLPEPQFIGNMPAQLAYVNDAANTQREIARGMVNYGKNNALIIRGLKKIYVNPLYWNDKSLLRNDGDAAFRIAANYSNDFLADKGKFGREMNTDHSLMLAMHQGISDAMATMSTYLGVPFEFAGPRGIPNLSKGNQMLLDVNSNYSPSNGYAGTTFGTITSRAAQTPSRITIPRVALNTKRMIQSSMNFNVGGSNMSRKDPLIHKQVFMHEFGHIGGFDHPHEYLDAVKEKYGHNHSEEMLNSIMSYDSAYAGEGYLLPADINAWRSNMGYNLAAPTIVKRLDRQWSLQNQPIAGGTPKYGNWLQSPSKFSKDKKQLPKVKKFGFGGFLDKLKFGLGGKGPGGPWGGLVTGMRNAVVGAGSKAVRFADTILTGGALTDLSRAIGESAKGNNKKSAKLAATGVAKGAFQMFGGKLIGAAFKPLAKFGGAYFLEKAGLAGAGISASQAVRLGIGTATRNALEREAVAIAGGRVATNLGINAFDSTILNPANIIDTQIARPKITLPSLTSGTKALTSGTKGGDLVPFSAKLPRILPVTERGNAPTTIHTFTGEGAKFDKQILDLFDELDAITLGQTENLATVTRREILRAKLQVSGQIPKVMQSPEELAFYNNMLNNLLGVFRNNSEGIGAHGGLLEWDIAGGFAEDLGIAFSRPVPGNIDPRIIPGSREVFDFQFHQIKIAEQIQDLLRDSDGVIPPDLRSSVTEALGLKPSSGQFLETTPWLHLPRQNQPLYNTEWMNSLYDEAQLATNALRDQMALAPKQLTAGTKGGALVPIKKLIPIKTYKAGTGVLGEMPKYNWDTGGLDLKQLGLYVHKIGKENVVFGGMKAPLQGLAKRNPSLNIKSVGLNPYEISGLKPGTADGDALANEWARAIIGFTDVMGNSKDNTFISALLYNWKRNKDLFAMLKFKEYASLGEIAVNEERVKMSGNAGDIIDTIIKSKKDYFSLKDLFVTHETPYPVDIDELGNLVLKPMSAFDTTSMVSFKGLYPGGPYNLGKNAEYFRDTLHFALNHRVTGHGFRENVQEGNFIISQLLPMLKNNPEALDNLYTVDTFFTPPPGQGLKFPAGTFKVVPIQKGSGISPRDELEKYIIEVLGITDKIDPGSTFGTMSASQIVQKYIISGGDHGSTEYGDNAVSYLFAKLLGVKTGRHFDQFNSDTMFGSMKQGANIKPSAYLNSYHYPMAGENAWSRVMSRNPFAQNFDMPYDNPQLLEKIKMVYDLYSKFDMSYPGGLPYSTGVSDLGLYNGGYIPTPGFANGGFIGPMLPKKKSFWGKVAGIGKGAFNIGKEILRPKNSFAIAGGILGGILGAPGGPAGVIAGGIGGSAAGGGIGSFVEQLFDKKKGFQPMNIGKNMLVQGALGALGLGVGAVAKRFVMPALAKYAKPGLSKAASLLGKGVGKASPYVDDVLKDVPAKQGYLLHHSKNDIKIGDFVRQRLTGSDQVTAGDALPGYSYAWDALTGVDSAVKNQVSGRISRFLPNGMLNLSVPEQFQDFIVYLTKAPKSSIYPDLNVPGSSARAVASAQEVIDSINIPAIISNDEAEMFVRNMLIKNNVPFNLNSELSREINKKFLFSKGSEALKDFHKGQFEEYATRVFRMFDKGAPAWAKGVIGEDAKLAHDLYLSGDIEKAKELLYGQFLRTAAGQKVSGLKNLLTIKQLTTKTPRFKKGGYLKFKEGGEVPSILHGGEYVLNAAAVKKYGLAHLEAMNQMKFNVPSAGFSVPQAAYSGSAAGGMTTSTQNVNIYVDNFIGEPEWFNSMMKDYNTKILPKNQKAAGLENRVISTYNGLNRGQ